MLQKLFSAILISSLFMAAFVYPVQASKGIPHSATFGYGAKIDPDDADLQNAIQSAVDLKLDWITIPINWSTIQPQVNSVIDWSKLDVLIPQAAQAQISVMIQLQNAPGWAQGSNGPVPEFVLIILDQLMSRYWPSIQAMELFPYANTVQGWGTSPDPESYMALLKTVQLEFLDKNCELFFVSSSLSTTALQTFDMSAETYLSRLYASGLAEITDIVGLSIQVDEDEDSSLGSIQTIESVREVMRGHDHTDGILWITHIQNPSGTIMESDDAFSQLCNQIRSRLYIGTLFVGTLSGETNLNGIDQANRNSNEQWFLISMMKNLISGNNDDNASAGT